MDRVEYGEGRTSDSFGTELGWLGCEKKVFNKVNFQMFSPQTIANLFLSGVFSRNEVQ